MYVSLLSRQTAQSLWPWIMKDVHIKKKGVMPLRVIGVSLLFRFAYIGSQALSACVCESGGKACSFWARSPAGSFRWCQSTAGGGETQGVAEAWQMLMCCKDLPWAALGASMMPLILCKNGSGMYNSCRRTSSGPVLLL